MRIHYPKLRNTISHLPLNVFIILFAMMRESSGLRKTGGGGGGRMNKSFYIIYARKMNHISIIFWPVDPCLATSAMSPV